MENVEAKLSLVQQLMSYRYDARRLKRRLAEPGEIADNRKDRDMERGIWRDYSYYRFCDKHEYELFQLLYDDTVSKKADDLTMQMLLGLKLHYKRLLRLSPQEWGRMHRAKVQTAPVLIPLAIQVKREQREGTVYRTTVEEKEAERRHRFRQSMFIFLSLILYVIVRIIVALRAWWLDNWFLYRRW